MLLIVLAECPHRTLKKNIVLNLKPKQLCQKRHSNKWWFLDFFLWTIFAYQKARSLFNLIINNYYQNPGHLENDETIKMPTNFNKMVVIIMHLLHNYFITRYTFFAQV